jgi:hypothetical protein
MNLHDQIRTAVTARLETARAAGERSPNWRVAEDDGFRGKVEHDGKHYAPIIYDEGYPTDAEARHIAANDPAFTIRQCERDLRVLDRHAPMDDSGDGGYCEIYHGEDESGWPCVEVRDLADAYGIDPS